MNTPWMETQTTIELSVRSRRFGTFRKAVQVEDAVEELERECLKGAVEKLANELEMWCRPKWPDPVTAALANMVAPCSNCGGSPTLVRFTGDGTMCLACMNPGCKEHLNTRAFRISDDSRIMLAEWNHLCMVARAQREKKEGGEG